MRYLSSISLALVVLMALACTSTASTVVPTISPTQLPSANPTSTPEAKLVPRISSSTSVIFPTRNPPSYERYKHPQYGWELDYPSGCLINPLFGEEYVGGMTSIGNPSMDRSIDVTITPGLLDARPALTDSHASADLGLYLKATSEGSPVIQVISSNDVMNHGHHGYLVEYLYAGLGLNIEHILAAFFIVGKDGYNLEISSNASDWDDFEDQAHVILESFQPSFESNGTKRWKSDSCTLEDGITVSNVLGRVADPGWLGLNVQVVGTIANSCSHPIDVQIIAQAFGTHGNILAAEREFAYEIYDKYMVPHPIPILHVVPGQPVVVGFHLNFYDVDNDEVKAVDIAVAEVDSAP